MKIINKITLGLVTATLLFVGCSQNATPAKKEVVKATISEDSLGLRKASLFNEAEIKPNGTEYSQNYAGSGHKIKRAFQDAPPMIPHDVTGLIPITINDNQCLGCHMPEVASSMGATPIPPSHFMDFRPVTTIAADGELEKNGHVIKNTSSEELKNVSIKSTHGKLYGGRYNCTQCHAPQATEPLAVKNNFQADYTDKDGANKSSWQGTKLMEGINTYESSK
ncbi:nitrate reductase cytochrome c-type subunit [Sulfurimonas sp.]|uniref:nitrate reductase cytochrome c-type subunit n=1 Tax=Sulfurimonas sp. TaxID=2022749 RepID=UPI002630FB72|nr:nitrate reductase cytochrome c-type subunit [Sulfurimonas sp.]